MIAGIAAAVVFAAFMVVLTSASFARFFRTCSATVAVTIAAASIVVGYSCALLAGRALRAWVYGA